MKMEKGKKCVRDKNLERERNFLRFSNEENKFFSRVLVAGIINHSVLFFIEISFFFFYFFVILYSSCLLNLLSFLVVSCRMTQNI